MALAGLQLAMQLAEAAAYFACAGRNLEPARRTALLLGRNVVELGALGTEHGAKLERALFERRKVEVRSCGRWRWRRLCSRLQVPQMNRRLVDQAIVFGSFEAPRLGTSNEIQSRVVVRHRLVPLLA